MERKKIEALSAMTWDDPIAVDWGDSAAEAVEEEPVVSPPPTGDAPHGHGHGRPQSYEGAGTEVGIKCVAIYTYQVCRNRDRVKFWTSGLIDTNSRLPTRTN